MGIIIIIAITLVVIIVFCFTKDTYEENKKVSKEGGIIKKYKVLIDSILSIDPHMKIISATNTYCYIATRETYGQVAFYLQHTYGQINIKIEFNNPDYGAQSLEFDFDENMPQEDMIYHIDKSVSCM